MKKIVDLLKESSKYSKVIDMANDIKDVLQIDSIHIDQLLDKVNSKEIRAYDLVKVEGFFSEFGCLEIPMTYTKQRAINEGMSYVPNGSGNLERVQKTFITTPLLPTVYPDDIDNHKIGFLYSTHEKNFEIGILDQDHIKINECNKFVPFFINNEMYYRYCQKYVRMLCEIVPLNEQMIEALINIEDTELKEIMSYFNNDYFPFITSYILVCKKIEEIPQDYFELNRTIWFAVEYEISNPNITDVIILSKFTKAYKKLNNYNLPLTFKKNDVKVCCDNKEGIQTAIKDNYIGFYKEVHPDKSLEYRQDMEIIEKYITEFLSILKLKCTLNYISDYRRKKTYESIIKNQGSE